MNVPVTCPVAYILTQGVGFLSTINYEVPLFQEDVLELYLNYHKAGNQTLKVGYIAAVNVLMYVLSHELFSESPDRFLQCIPKISMLPSHAQC